MNCGDRQSGCRFYRSCAMVCGVALGWGWAGISEVAVAVTTSSAPWQWTPTRSLSAEFAPQLMERNPTATAQLPSHFLYLSQYYSEPDAVIPSATGTVTIQFVNLTGAAIDYAVIEQTDFRTLSGRSRVTLEQLPQPTSLVFHRQDRGLLSATLQVQPNSTLVVTVQATTDLGQHRKAVDIDEVGRIHLY
jgi:hypothetical protein